MVLLLRAAVLLQLVVLILVMVIGISDSKSSIALNNSTKFSFTKWKTPFKKFAKMKRVTKKPNQKQDRQTINPEAYMTAPEIIRNRGYPVEIHSVVTDDGYVLEVHRIPRSKTASSTAPLGKPIFMQHGFSSGSTDYILSPTERALAFRLSDLGYDVWLGNARGNDYSRKHTFLNPNGEAYWRFSWDEMGKYDIPAEINYVLAQTGRSKLSYIGHSMGCAIFFVAMITHPELNDKIEVMVALAPATSLARMRSPIRYIAPFARPLQLFLWLVQTRVFLPNETPFHQLQERFCRPEDRHLSLFCLNTVFAAVDDNLENISPELWPVMDRHTPIGTSVRTAAQFAQNYNSGETFIPFSYGWFRNFRRYGRITPPPYDLSKVTAPVYIFYGPNDTLVGPLDAAWLARKLGNCKANIRVDLDLYNHFDFLFATDNNRLIYDQLIRLLPSAS